MGTYSHSFGKALNPRMPPTARHRRLRAKIFVTLTALGESSATADAWLDDALQGKRTGKSVPRCAQVWSGSKAGPHLAGTEYALRPFNRDPGRVPLFDQIILWSSGEKSWD
jgi:hypothetical protein